MPGRGERLKCNAVFFSGHAFERMFERGILEADVVQVVRQGSIIESYPEDSPYPSCLLMGVVNKTPMHVVVSRDSAREFCYVITAYHPDPTRWLPDWKTRRTP